IEQGISGLHSPDYRHEVRRIRSAGLHNLHGDTARIVLEDTAKAGAARRAHRAFRVSLLRTDHTMNQEIRLGTEWARHMARCLESSAAEFHVGMIFCFVFFFGHRCLPPYFNSPFSFSNESGDTRPATMCPNPEQYSPPSATRKAPRAAMDTHSTPRRSQSGKFGKRAHANASITQT